MVVGTRFLASSEANIAAGYQDAVLAAADGGVSTVRTEVFDRLRITPWPGGYDGRAVKNASWEDDERGEEWEKVKERFEEDMKKGDDAWGVQGRATTYAGAGVGLVRDVKPAGQIVVGMREEAVALLRGGGGFNGV